MLVSCIYEGVVSCVFVGLECMSYMVDGLVVLGNAKAFYVWVVHVDSKSSHVSIVWFGHVKQLGFVWLEDVFFVIAHMLCITEF